MLGFVYASRTAVCNSLSLGKVVDGKGIMTQEGDIGVVVVVAANLTYADSIAARFVKY